MGGGVEATDPQARTRTRDVFPLLGSVALLMLGLGLLQSLLGVRASLEGFQSLGHRCRDVELRT